MLREGPRRDELTAENLAHHTGNSGDQKTAAEKEMLKRYREEHDQYRQFLVTGSTSFGQDGTKHAKEKEGSKPKPK